MNEKQMEKGVVEWWADAKEEVLRRLHKALRVYQTTPHPFSDLCEESTALIIHNLQTVGLECHKIGDRLLQEQGCVPGGSIEHTFQFLANNLIITQATASEMKHVENLVQACSKLEDAESIAVVKDFLDFHHEVIIKYMNEMEGMHP